MRNEFDRLYKLIMEDTFEEQALVDEGIKDTVKKVASKVKEAVKGKEMTEEECHDLWYGSAGDWAKDQIKEYMEKKYDFKVTSDMLLHKDQNWQHFLKKGIDYLVSKKCPKKAKIALQYIHEYVDAYQAKKAEKKAKTDKESEDLGKREFTNPGTDAFVHIMNAMSEERQESCCCCVRIPSNDENSIYYAYVGNNNVLSFQPENYKTKTTLEGFKNHGYMGDAIIVKIKNAFKKDNAYGKAIMAKPQDVAKDKQKTYKATKMKFYPEKNLVLIDLKETEQKD